MFRKSNLVNINSLWSFWNDINSGKKISNSIYRLLGIIFLFSRSLFCRRASSGITGFLKKRKKASITVETALVLPLFIFGMVNLLYGITCIESFSRITAAMHETGNEICSYGYAIENGIGEGIPSGVVSNVYAASSIAKHLGGGFNRRGGVKGGIAGLSYAGSSIMSDSGIVKLTITYSIKYPVNMSLRSLRLGTTYYGHAWVGYDVLHGISEGVIEDPIVYITPSGTVYHTDLGCSHLNPSTTSVTREAASHMRSSDGSIYYACELCGAGTGVGHVYITNYGNRYHSNLYCSGIKRNVQAVHLSEVGGRRACMTCGG